MFKQALMDHFVGAGLNPDNMNKEHIDAYFDAAKSPEGAYLPDESVSSIDRASDTLSRLAADNPEHPVALTHFLQPDRPYLVTSFLWNDLIRVDLLFPFAPSFDGTMWVTAASASRFIHDFLFSSENEHAAVKATETDAPEWAENGFVLLIGIPPSGSSVVDGPVTFDESVSSAGAVQRAGSSVFGHHTLNHYELSDDELAAIMRLLGITVAGKTVSMASLLAVGEMNPFASSEQLILRSTVGGTVVIGKNAVVGPLVNLADGE